MKAIRNNRLWIWAPAILLLVVFATLAYIFLPGRGSLPAQPVPDYWPTDGWQTSTPEQQGLDSAKLAERLQSFHDKNIAIDSLLIVRNGYIVLDAYYSPYDGSFPHDMASVGKSVTGILVGIAIDQGKLQLDSPMVSFFPDRTIANLDERKQSITVRDLVSMRNGMDSQCFQGDEPTLDAMRSQPDWVQAALDRKMVSQPGTRFCYDSPGMHILSAILQEATGMTEFDFARQYLFEPLGISDVVWETDPQGYSHGWGDLHLKPEDSAKLGYLWLHGGNWNGKQIVSASWVSNSIQAQSRMVGNDYGYGYGWWVSPVDFYAEGREGQFIRVIPSMNMVVVITGGGDIIDQVMPLLIKILLTSTTQLPENPAGLAQLKTTLTLLAQDSVLQPSSSLPDAARAISGKTYVCDTNAVSVDSLRFDFNDSEVATLYLTRYGMEMVWPVGLDGKYRLSTEGQGQRGYWMDAHTFIFETFDIGRLTRQLNFDGDNLELVIPEAGLTITCHVQNP
jgi:CubicO group peptidase (beta-lactamase class C family)